MSIKSTILLPILILISIFALSPINAAEAPSSMEYQGTKLKLNGQGTRVKFFMKVYDTSLYLGSASSDAEEILDSDEAMAVRLDVTSTMVTIDAMKDALSEGLVKSTGNNTGPITEEIEQLISTFTGDVTDSDFFEFIYMPDAGTNVLKNSTYIDTIPGIEFKKAFFGIWLSKNPIQKNLKKAMLGG
ncbi:chalcone isomerase family protein [Candidatus Thioglobus sp.]|nr:chalcone isomerase family protein [Candidatus Thioglobus sp.]MDC1290078.1 chalcone isomerase family protein [Candidatus Thioglobus sp.]